MINNIKWKDHPILGDLELDFTKTDGTTYSTIILAGENGTGKTTILESLSRFLNLGSIEGFQHIKYTINNTPYTLTPDDHYANIGFHFRKNDNDGMQVQITSNKNNNMNNIENDITDIRHYGCTYSKARSGFITKK